MFKWFNEAGFEADIPALRRDYPEVAWTSLEQWLTREGWVGKNVYTRHSHADVIVGKILEGFLHDGREGPRMRLASMYVDQFPAGDTRDNLVGQLANRCTEHGERTAPAPALHRARRPGRPDGEPAHRLSHRGRARRVRTAGRLQQACFEGRVGATRPC